MALIAVGNQKKANLLANITIGYTSTPTTGGSSYYTTTTGSSAPGYIAISGGSGSNQMVYSTDRVNWTGSTMPAIMMWKDAVYGNGKFVAIASSTQNYGGPADIAAYSTDGINWTATTMPSSQGWNSITYGDGKFIATSDTAEGAYSTDGINWTATTMPSYAYSAELAYGNGKFVALINNGGTTTLPYSTDGINWTQTTLSRSLQTMTFADGKFFAVGYLGDTAYSTNGINWTEGNAGALAIANNSWTSIALGNGKFVLHSNGNAITSSTYAYSTDGINWTISAMPTSGRWTSIFADGKFLALTGGNTYTSKAAYSTDGINWTATTMPEGEWLNAFIDGQISTLVEIQTLIGGSGSGTAEILAPIAIYTTPALKTATVVLVQVVNLSSPGITYDLGKLAAGSTLTEANSTILDKAVAGNSTDTLNNTFNMVAADSITVLPSTVDTVQVLVYGVEEYV